MIDYSYYKSIYEREQDLRNSHSDRIGAFVTLTVAIITADAFLCEKVAPWNGFPLRLFYLTSATIAVMLLLQIIFICLSFVSLKYHYQDFPIDMLEDDIDEHMRKYKEEHHWASEEKLENERSSYTMGMFERVYKLCANTYYKENIRRRKKYFWLSIVSIINVIIIILFYIIAFVYQFRLEV